MGPEADVPHASRLSGTRWRRSERSLHLVAAREREGWDGCKLQHIDIAGLEGRSGDDQAAGGLGHEKPAESEKGGGIDIARNEGEQRSKTVVAGSPGVPAGGDRALLGKPPLAELRQRRSRADGSAKPIVRSLALPCTQV